MEALILSTVLLVVDWGQTREIAVNPRYSESAYLLGANPSPLHVDLYFGAAIIGNVLLSGSIKDKRTRKRYDYAVAATEFGFVAGNRVAGIKMNWKF